ncbi:MAG: M48 family metalloprotease [Erythrobacter sp.]
MAEEIAVYRNQRLASYIETIGRQAARKKARYPENFVFTLVDDSVFNAYASIGGYLYVQTGALVWLNDEAELVALIGHEVGHAVKRHSARKINRDNVSKGMLRLAALRRRNPQELEALQIKAALALKGFGRDQEFESDQIGAEVLKDLGYDTYGAARLAYQLHLRSLYVASLTGKKSDVPLAWSSHPPSMDRVRRNLDTAKRIGGNDLPRHRDRYLSMVDGLKINLSIYGGPRVGTLRVHTVKPGETAQSIAAKLPVKKPLEFLLATNGLDAASEVKPGAKLKIFAR